MSEIIKRGRVGSKSAAIYATLDRQATETAAAIVEEIASPAHVETCHLRKTANMLARKFTAHLTNEEAGRLNRKLDTLPDGIHFPYQDGVCPRCGFVQENPPQQQCWQCVMISIGEALP